MKRLTILAIAMVLTFACSKTEKHAGSASVTTNGTITGKITDTAGTALPNASAILIASDFDPNVDAPTTMRTTLTDSQGKYVFEDVPEGHYRLVVNSADSSEAATVEEINVEEGSDVVVPSVPLVKPGSIAIRITDFAYLAGDRFFLPGTNIQIVVTDSMVAESLVVIANVPAGIYSQVFYFAEGAALSMPLVSKPIQVLSGKQLFIVPDYEGITGIPVGFFTVGLEKDTPLGGAEGETVTVQDTMELRQALEDDTARVVRIEGWLQGSGQILHVGSNKTILGIGDSATLDSIGFAIIRKTNVVIRNLHFSNSSDDAISVEQSTYVWVDHNSFNRCADGQIDIKRASDWVTVSWNHFQNQKLASSVGHSDDNGAQDSTKLHVTYHHNWFEDIEGSAPRVRYGTVHVYNNVYDSALSYAIASTQYAQVVVESNLFIKVKEPTRIQHTSPNPGELTEAGNLLDHSGEIVTNGITFDPVSFYNYSAQNASGVRAAVVSAAGAGRIAALK